MGCNFEKLSLYLDKKLGLDGQLEILEHLEYRETCFETITCNNDAKFFLWHKLEDKLAG